MEPSDLINLKRVEIVEETDDFYRVKYQDQMYDIAKSTESSFVINGAPSAQRLELKPTLERRLIPETEIFHDKEAPQEYKEVMVFHKIREMEYKKAGFGDAHKRAENDEILYVMKFLSDVKLEDYLDWAEGYREKHRKAIEKKKIKELEEQLTKKISSPENVYKAGLQLSDNEFELVKEKLINIIAQSSEWSSIAGKDWSDKRFKPFAEQIANAVAQDSMWVYYVGKEWSDKRFKPFAKQFVNAVAQDSELSYLAGRDWPGKHFNLFAEQLVNAVAQDSEWSLGAGMDWSDKRFEPFAEQIANAVAQDSMWVYYVGKEWPDKRFKPSKEKLVQSLLKDPEFTQKALKDWPEERRKYLKKVINRILKSHP